MKFVNWVKTSFSKCFVSSFLPSPLSDFLHTSTHVFKMYKLIIFALHTQTDSVSEDGEIGRLRLANVTGIVESNRQYSLITYCSLMFRSLFLTWDLLPSHSLSMPPFPLYVTVPS